MLEALAILWQILDHFPELIGEITEIKKLWESYHDAEQRAQDAKALKDALEKSKESHDTTDITEVVNGILTSSGRMYHS